MTAEEKTKKQLTEKIEALEKRLVDLNQQDGAVNGDQAKLRAFANSSPDVMLIMDEKGTYIEILTSQNQLLVSNPENMIGKNVREVLSKDEADIFLKLIKKTIKTNSPQILEYELEVQGGKRWFEGRCSKIAGIKEQMVVFVTRDVTERKKAEAALISSEERFRLIMDTSPDYIWMLDKDLNILYGNRAGEGYKIDELIGTSVLKLFPKKIQREQKKHLEKALASESPYYYEIDFPVDNGPNLVFENIAIPTISKGIVTGLTINSRDISERKRADRLLRALNQASLALSPKHSPEQAFNLVANELQKLGFSSMLFPLDESGDNLLIKYINYDSKLMKSAEKLVGFEAKNFSINLDKMDLFRNVIRSKKAAIIDQPGSFVRKVLPKNLQKLTPQIVKLLKLPKSIPAPLIIDGKVIGLFSVLSDDLSAEDIPAIVAFADHMAAAFQKAELLADLEESYSDLSEANEKFSKSFYSSPSAMLITSYPDYRVIELNQRFKDLFGLGEEDMNSEELIDWRMWVNSEEQKYAMDQVAEIGSLHNFESLSQTKTGKLLNIVSSFVVLETKSGKIMLTTTSDVTETRNAEQNLRESEERYRTLSASTFEGIAITEKGMVIDGNQQMASMLGYEPKELIGVPVGKLVHPDDQEFVGKKIKDGSEAPYEHRAIRKDGKVIDLEVRGKMMERDGKISRVTVLRDISQQKKSQAEIERRLLELTSIQAISSLGLKTTDEDQIISGVTKLLSDTFFPDHFGILLLDKQNNVLRPHSSYTGLAAKEWVTEIELGQGVIGQVAATSKAILLNSTDEFPDYIRPRDSAYKSELCVPIGSKDSLIGVINVEKEEAHGFSKEDERLLVLVASQLSTAIERARLFSREKQLRIEAEALHNSALTISTSLDLDTILTKIAEHVCKLLNATSVYLSSYDPVYKTSKVIAEYFSTEASKKERVSDLGKNMTLHMIFL